jgi:hypothetical protein
VELDLAAVTREELEGLAAAYNWPREAEALACGAAARDRGFYTRDDLVWLEAWKAGGGRRRSAHHNDDAYVRYLTEHALAPAAGRDRGAAERLRIEQLTLLSGVRYRMASVLPHFGHPFAPAEAGYPMMDRFSVCAVGLGDFAEPSAFESFELWWDHVGRCRRLSTRRRLDLRVVDRALMVAGQRE